MYTCICITKLGLYLYIIRFDMCLIVVFFSSGVNYINYIISGSFHKEHIKKNDVRQHIIYA